MGVGQPCHDGDSLIMVSFSCLWFIHVLTDHEPSALSIYMGLHAMSGQSTCGLPHLPPAYDTLAECSQLTLVHFRFPHDVVTLMECNALSIQQCERVHAALQLESQHWVPSFIYAGIPMDVALELQDIFEAVALLEDTGGSSESERGEASDPHDVFADNSEVEAFIDLTLED